METIVDMNACLGSCKSDEYYLSKRFLKTCFLKPASKAITSILAIVTLITLSGPSAYAANKQASHIHGVAFVTVVVDKTQVVVAIDTPLHNLVGFGHPPTSAMQNDKLAQMKAKLKRSGLIVDVAAAGRCVPARFELDDPFARKPHSNHADVYFSYEFTCEKPEKVDQVEFHLFKQYPGIKMLRVQWLKANDYGSGTLNKMNTRLFLR